MEEHKEAFQGLLNEVQGHIDHIIKESYVAPKNAMEHWSGSRNYSFFSFLFSSLFFLFLFFSLHILILFTSYSLY